MFRQWETDSTKGKFLIMLYILLYIVYCYNSVRLTWLEFHFKIIGKLWFFFTLWKQTVDSHCFVDKQEIMKALWFNPSKIEAFFFTLHAAHMYTHIYAQTHTLKLFILYLPPFDLFIYFIFVFFFPGVSKASLLSFSWMLSRLSFHIC